MEKFKLGKFLLENINLLYYTKIGEKTIYDDDSGQTYKALESGWSWKPELKNGNLCFIQYQEEPITKYFVRPEHKELKDIQLWVLIKNKWVNIEKNLNEKHEYLIDFKNPFKQFKITSNNNLFDPVIFNCVFEYGDEKRYKENEEKRKENNFKIISSKIQPRAVTGNSLVNIYWNEIENCKKTIVTLTFRGTTIKKVTLSHNKTFTTFKDLAYGGYSCTIKQYDNKKEIGESSVYFVIKEPGAKRVIRY